MAATQALTQQKPVGTLMSMLDQSKQQIAMALPQHMTADRMIRIAITAVRKQPKLLDCSSLSIVGCIIEASQLGLYPDGILGDAYLVPYFNGKTRQMEAQLQPGYRGLINLARRSGMVSSIYSEPVYACDKFKVELGTEHTIVHEPNYDDDKRGIEKDDMGVPVGMRGVYAVVKFKDGTSDFEYMPLHRIMDIRNNSKSKNKDGDVFGPWSTHFEEMARKTPIRRLAKRLPLSPEFQKAAILDEYVDAGVAPDLASEVDINSEAMRIATDARSAELDAKYLKSSEGGASAASVADPSMAVADNPDSEPSLPDQPLDPAIQERREELKKQEEQVARRRGRKPAEQPEEKAVQGVSLDFHEG